MIELVAMALLQQGPNDVFERHDREPAGFHRGGRDRQADDECHEHHNLMPDGDNDCDDVVRSVPVDGGWAPAVMLVLGSGGVWWVTRRRQK